MTQEDKLVLNNDYNHIDRLFKIATRQGKDAVKIRREDFNSSINIVCRHYTCLGFKVKPTDDGGFILGMNYDYD